MNDLFSDISYIGDDGTRRFNILINGCWQCLKSTRTFDVTNPATGELIGRVPQCDPEDVRSAIESARNNTDIKGYSPLHRLEIMERAREILMEQAEFFAETISRESGKPIAISRGEVTATAERLRLTMEETRVLYGEYLPGEWVEDTQNKFAIVIRKPLGVVAIPSS